MFGELLAAVLPVELDVTFSEVSCPSRIVAVVIANTGTADERYALRVDGEVRRTELVPAGTTVISRVRLVEDRPATLAVHTAGESVGSARRTADCASASPPPAKGGTPAPEGGVSERRRSTSPSPSASAGTTPSVPGGGVPVPPAGAPDVEATSKAAEERPKHKKKREKKADKRKKRGNVLAGATRKGMRERRLPMTGMSPALAFTAAATAATGGILTWYGLLWPRRRHPAFPSRERSRS
ncbi:hypothetical protein ABGB12_24180 [Actinocorallia sp. B10E7]|uniref:hypothetical protein n=1 Tax=Actinocorallia sp. B10E7 TaxID=3153558 RepID=UPI00325ECB1B